MRNIIHHRTLREQVADAIRKKILQQELEPGMRITESEFAKEFDVSHGPVREALRQLEQEGLVEYRRNVGCSVCNISTKDVVEALLMRGSYEMMAARACGGRFSGEALDAMTDILESMKQMDEKNLMDPAIYDNAFHRVLICEAQMPYLIKAWDALDFVTYFAFYDEKEDCSVLADAQYEIHKKLFDVYVSGECEAVCKIISEHYKQSIDRILQDHDLRKEDFPFSFDILDLGGVIQ